MTSRPPWDSGHQSLVVARGWRQPAGVGSVPALSRRPRPLPSVPAPRLPGPLLLPPPQPPPPAPAAPRPLLPPPFLPSLCCGSWWRSRITCQGDTNQGQRWRAGSGADPRCPQARPGRGSGGRATRPVPAASGQPCGGVTRRCEPTQGATITRQRPAAALRVPEMGPPRPFPEWRQSWPSTPGRGPRA